MSVLKSLSYFFPLLQFIILALYKSVPTNVVTRTSFAETNLLKHKELINNASKEEQDR